jgi:hypothetical protein
MYKLPRPRPAKPKRSFLRLVLVLCVVLVVGTVIGTLIFVLSHAMDASSFRPALAVLGL